jgi:hypothetical protein
MHMGFCSAAMLCLMPCDSSRPAVTLKLLKCQWVDHDTKRGGYYFTRIDYWRGLHGQ